MKGKRGEGEMKGREESKEKGQMTRQEQGKERVK